MKFITIGGATQDAIIQYKPQEMLKLHTARGKQTFLIIEEGKKIEVSDLQYFTGGGATNSAVSLKRLGFEVDVVCKVGSDTPAEFVIKKLNAESVGTKLIKKSTGLPTGVSFIIPSREGDRCIFAHRGANIELTHNDIPFDAIKKADCLYITSLSGDSSQLMDPITDFAKEHGVRVANNPGVSQLASGAHALCKSLKNIEILIINAQEANEFMQSLVQTDQELRDKISHTCDVGGNEQEPSLIASPIHYADIQFNIQDFFKEVLSRGPKVVVVTNGAEGVYVATQEKVYFHPSITPQTIVNTLGAGDAFASCFTAQIFQGASIAQALKAGVLNASSVVGHLDAKSGLLSKQELEKKLQTVSEKALQQFAL